MTPNEPFLVLISPNVADVGHTYVIADSMNQPSPGFADLQQQCDFLQELSRLDDPTACLAVERRVTQWSTSDRGAREWLVCSALPQDLKAADKVHAVLRELWSQIYDVKDQAAATWLKKATQKHGDVFHAPRMTEITQRFRNHPQLSGITWLPITSTSSKKALPPQKSRRYNMKHWIAYIGASIALIGLLAWGAPYVFERPGDADDDKIEAPDADAPSQEEKNWKEWHEVLSSDDRWKKLLAETGGQEAFQAWETAKKAAAVEAEKNNSLKNPFGSKPRQPKGSVPHVLQQQQQVVKKLDEWKTLYGKEFNLSRSSPKEVNDAPMTKYLRRANPPWHRNINNQISEQGSELSFSKNAAKELEEFASSFGKHDTPEALRAIWKALDAFSKSNPNDDVKPFRDVVKRELESMPAPPENYSILTLKDVERVKRLQIVFGSEEFGLIVTGRRFQKEERWDIIKKSVVSAISQIERMAGPERALLEGLKTTFGNTGSAKPSSPKSP